MADKRRRPRLHPPPIGKPPDAFHSAVCAYLTNDQYRKWYAVVMSKGTSGADAMRQLIEDAYEALPDSDK